MCSSLCNSPLSVLLFPGPLLFFAAPHAYAYTQPGPGAYQKGSTLGGRPGEQSCTSLQEPRTSLHSWPLNSDNLHLPAVNLLSHQLHGGGGNQPLPPPSSAPHPPQGAVSSAFPISSSGMMGSASGQELRGGCSREGGEGASLGPRIKSVFPESQATRSTEALQMERQKLREKRKGKYLELIGMSQVQLPCKICIAG